MTAAMRKRLAPYTRPMMNLWPPLLFAGIRITRLERDFSAVDVELRMHWWNRNIVGVHYGGSIFSMTDPFYMIMLLQRLGDDYIVWDKSASVRYRRPGNGTLRAEFRLDAKRLAAIIADMDAAAAAADPQETRPPRIEPVFEVRIHDAAGTLVAEVQRTIHIQRKQRK